MNELFEMLGATYGWCGIWVMDWKEYTWDFLYWPSSEQYFLRWILPRKPLVIMAGFMSRARGRRFNRRNIRTEN